MRAKEPLEVAVGVVAAILVHRASSFMGWPPMRRRRVVLILNSSTALIDAASPTPPPISAGSTMATAAPATAPFSLGSSLSPKGLGMPFIVLPPCTSSLYHRVQGPRSK
jgi:hypothetical protein